MANEYNDPYTQVLAELWEHLESKTYFTNIVKEPNMIKLMASGSQDRRPMKDSLTESDVPEVMIYPGGARYWEERDASGASVHRIYAILVTSGNRIVNPPHGYFLEVEWAITRAMFDYHTCGS